MMTTEYGVEYIDKSQRVNTYFPDFWFFVQFFVRPNEATMVFIRTAQIDAAIDRRRLVQKSEPGIDCPEKASAPDDT